MAEQALTSTQEGQRRMKMGPETPETMLLEIGAGMVVVGTALITVGIVAALLVRRQYGVVVPLGFILAAVALLVWWEPVARVLVSFPLLVIGYTWLFAWWRASKPGHGRLPFQRHQSRSGVPVVWGTQGVAQPGRDGEA